MIDYLTEVKDLHDSSVSNADIAAHLNAKTANSMQAQASVYVLQDSGAVLIDPVTGQKFGTFISYYTSLPDGDSKNLIAFALDRWYSGEDVKQTNILVQYSLHRYANHCLRICKQFAIRLWQKREVACIAALQKRMLLPV